MHADFAHLRVRSAFSLLEGALSEKTIIKACIDSKMPAVALTDHANLFAIMPFCKHALSQGVQPIVGCLLPVRMEITKPQALSSHIDEYPLMPVLVQNEEGYLNLLSLLSQAYLNCADHEKPLISIDELKGHHEGLILFSGGATGPAGWFLHQQNKDLAVETLEGLSEIFGDRFYMEIQRHQLFHEMAIEEDLLDLAFALDIPLVATNDVHFHRNSEFTAQDALSCIGQGQQLATEERYRLNEAFAFKTPDEMKELFADLPEAIANTLIIAQRSGFAAPERGPILPPFNDNTSESEDETLRRQAFEGLRVRLQDHVLNKEMSAEERVEIEKEYSRRLDFELGVIIKMKYSGYFLIVADFINWAKQKGIAVGPGRGSGAGSAVAWSLRITDLDPIRFGLLFERFLNPDRVSMPDFDIDFCQDRRDEVIGYVQEKYGRDKVAAIITFGKLQARAALRDIGRVLGLPFNQVDRISKMIPFNPANPPSLKQALDLEPRLDEARRSDSGVSRMVDLALTLEGLPRHASTHAAGIVIGDRPLKELIPLFRDPRSSMPVTQFNMKDVEKAGLVKFDFLGLTTLTMLQLGERLVRQSGIELELEKLSLDDKKSYEIMANADTSGIFQLESGGMRDALRHLKPDCFEDIIAMVSLYRPGPMDNIPRYIAVKHGHEQAEYLHPLLEPILSETNGVIIYQEQVMEIAKQLAGYTLAGADLLRRAMGKKIKEEMDAQRGVFTKGAAKRGISEELANTIFDSVAKFASYGFNKSHAAAYALLAYQTAYLKANHPVEFYAAVMTMEMANFEKLGNYRQEMQQKNIPLYPPDINKSIERFSVENGKDGKGVRYALCAIKGVGAGAMQHLVEERNRNGPFADIFDFVLRVGPKNLSKKILEGLIKAGALDGLHHNRLCLIKAIEGSIRYAQTMQEDQVSDQNLLFGDPSATIPKPALNDDEEWKALEKLQFEFEHLGSYFSAHPLDVWRPVLRELSVTKAIELKSPENQGPKGAIRMAGVLISRQEKKTERSRFAILLCSDDTATFEVMLFNEQLEQARPLLEQGRILLITADTRNDGGEIKLSGHRVELLEEKADIVTGSLEIELSSLACLSKVEQFFVTSARPAQNVYLILPVQDGAGRAVIALDKVEVPFENRQDIAHIKGVSGLNELTSAQTQSFH